MATVIECKICGGNIEPTGDGTYGVCDHCGRTMTLPKVDDDQLAAAFNRGNHFRRIGEFDKALAVYERILQEDDKNAEAHWNCALCRFGIEYVEDPATYDWIPTCHRASFDSFLEDVDYLAAVQYSDGNTRRQYQRDAARIAEVQRAIIATSQNEEPYDVFICYKDKDSLGNRTVDSMLAQDIYYQLTDQGRRVFFARITLDEIPSTRYEPYIFAALNSAKVMVVVGTCREYLDSTWVKNEWSRFLALMRKDRSRTLLLCHRDMDPYDMPEQLSALHSHDMSRIGFIQDLTRGIAKVLDGDKKPQNVTVQQVVSNNVASLLDRGNMALEDGEWDKADHFFEEVLNQDSKNPGAYIGKALVEEKCATLEKLAAKRLALTDKAATQAMKLEPDTAHINRMIDRCVIPGFLERQQITQLYNFDLTYQNGVEQRKQQRLKEKTYWDGNRLLNRAAGFGGGAAVEAAKKQVFDRMDGRIAKAQEQRDSAVEDLKQRYRAHLEKADQKAEALLQEAQQRREERYRKNQTIAETSQDVSQLRQAMGVFQSLRDYKDSAALAKQCGEKIDRLEAERKNRERVAAEEKRARDAAAAEARRRENERLAAERKKKETRKNIVSFIVSVLLIGAVVAGVWYLFARVIPGNRYEKADGLMAEGSYLEAGKLFDKLNDYQDAEARMEECFSTVYQQAEELVAKEKYPEAAEIFTQLGDYKDSAQRVTECQDAKYAKDIADIEALAEQGKTAEAALAFAAMGEKARSMELWDKIAQRKVIDAQLYLGIAIKNDGTVVNSESKLYFEYDLSDWSQIVDVAASENYLIGLREDGTVMGYGVSSEKIDVSRWTDVVAIDASTITAAALHYDGTVSLTGNIGVGASNEALREAEEWTGIISIMVSTNHIVGLKADGTVVAVGDNDYGQCDVQGWTDIVAIYGDYGETIGLKSDGTVVYTGYRAEDYDSLSGWTNIVSIATSGDHIVGLRADGTLIAKGNNTYHECEVADVKNAVAIAVTDSDTIAVLADGTVFQTGITVDEAADWTDIKVPE